MQVKAEMKGLLARAGLWYPLDFGRKMPAILSWLASGCNENAPQPIKLMTIRWYLRNSSVRHFIETGTYSGDTLAHIAGTGIGCTSIELSQEMYEAAVRRFKRYKNVKLVHGDSAIQLPKVLSGIDDASLFWLDGHYSGGVTASAELHSPVSAELRAIFDHSVKKHVILIDDARCFDGRNGYPHLDELLRVIREEGRYNASISMDIIRVVPLT